MVDLHFGDGVILAFTFNRIVVDIRPKDAKALAGFTFKFGAGEVGGSSAGIRGRRRPGRARRATAKAS